MNIKRLLSLCWIYMLVEMTLYAQKAPIAVTRYGTLQGINEFGISVFKGIPYADPPIGDNRWRDPQPVKPWQGIRMADKFGNDPMQGNPFGDMGFAAEKKSEDCLYLNVWTPAETMTEKLPVLIYFNGGGFIAGSGSEPRYAGMSMARQGIVTVTANYREGIFGFFAHPELSKETSYQGSGNYGFMDQIAAIKWVYENITAFGGDPNKITVAGESAGATSVCALLTSPLTKGLISKAIASSGSVFGRDFISQEEANQEGIRRLDKMNLKHIKDARRMSAEELLDKSLDYSPVRVIDKYVFDESPIQTYIKGKQQKVPLLIGRNSMEMTPQFLLGEKTATLENIHEICKQLYGDNASKVMNIYGLRNDKDVTEKPGVDLASDLFTAYGTWYFGYIHAATSGQPVYRYYFSHPRPAMIDKSMIAGLAGGTAKTNSSITSIPETEGFKGAVHSADIEYAMGTLPTNRVYDWQPEDFLVSDQFIHYYANFIKTGNPNGLGLADWNPINDLKNPPQLIIDVNSHEVCDEDFENRYRFLMELNQ